jgi:subtilisin family serine protease
MKKKYRVAIAFALTALLTTAVLPVRSTSAYSQDPVHTSESQQANEQTPNFIRGRVLVRFRSETMSLARRDLIAEAGARDAGSLPATGVHILELPVEADEEATVRALQTRPEVEFAELDRLVPPAEVVPDDPWYTNWEWHLRKINGPGAWSLNTGTGSVVLAILDTGVDASHEDLAPKMVPGWNIYGNNSDTRDVTGHGTLVAGTAAASSNNAVGVASVAWGCRIMPVRVSDSTGYASFSNMASGLTWAADHGARIANLSYRASTSSAVTTAAQYFQNRGGVVTVAAGNEAVFESAADNPYVLTVSGSNPDDLLYAWSNTGNNIDLAAPGNAYSTTRGGGYSAVSGTSIAAPIVAGVAALVLSNNPNLTGQEVQDTLKQSADDCGTPGWDSSYGWGRVNAERALSGAGGGGGDTTPPNLSFMSPSSGATVSSTVPVQVDASDNVGVASVTLSVDGVSPGTDSASPYSFNWDTLSSTNGSHTLVASARDAAGNTSTASISVTVNNLIDTTPPGISILSPANGGRVSGQVSVLVSATDQVGVVRVDLYVDGALTSSTTTAPFTTKWNARRARAGAHTIQCRAYDAAGNVGLSANCTVYR